MIFDSQEQRDFIYDAIRKAVGWSYEEVMRKSQQFGNSLQEAPIIPLARQKEIFASEFVSAQSAASKSGDSNSNPIKGSDKKSVKSA